MRAALYLRVSDPTTQTYENQRAPLEELAAARKWTPVWYEETGSAAKARPVFERMLEDARRRRVRAIGIVSLDRFGRSLAENLRLVKELDALECGVVSVRESWLDTTGPARMLLVAVFSWVAEYELELNRDRTKKGQQRARLRGTKSGKPIGRPRASALMLGAAARLVQQKTHSIRKAAAAQGTYTTPKGRRRPVVSASSLRRHLNALKARLNDDGGPGRAAGAPQE